MRISRMRFRRGLLAVLFVVSLPGCGFVDSGGSQGVPVEDPTNRQVQEQRRVILDAAALVDTSTVVSYRWSQIRGPDVALEGANTQVASFIAPAVKAPNRIVFVFRLTVTDEFGLSNDTDVTITVVPVNAPPIVNAGPDKAVSEGARVTLVGTVQERDGTIAASRWSQIAGPPAALANAASTQTSFVAPNVATPTPLTFRLTATDDEGATDTDEVVVTVNPVVAPPPIPPDDGIPPGDGDDDDGDDDEPGDGDDDSPPGPPPDADDDVGGGDDDDDGPGPGGPDGGPGGGGPDNPGPGGGPGGPGPGGPGPGGPGSGDDDDDDEGDDDDDDDSSGSGDGDDLDLFTASRGVSEAKTASGVKSVAGGSKALTLDVLRNDRAFGSVLEPGSIRIVEPPKYGVAVANRAGQVIYTRRGDSTGAIDAFRYTVRDARGRTSNVATVTILPSEPAACWTAPRGQPVTGKLPAGSARATMPMYRLVADARDGTVSMLDPTTGKFRYTPTLPAAGGADDFVYATDSARDAPRFTARVLTTPAVMALGGDVAAGVINGAQNLPPSALRVGYRRTLARLLAAEGYAIDFVGTQHFGSRIEQFDGQTEAHGGWSATELAYGRKGDGSDGVYGWLAAHPADLVLLQLGIEHLADGPAGVEAILNEIDRWEASVGRPVIVVLSGIVSRPPSAPAIQAFNAGVAAMVARRAAGSLGKPDQIVLIRHGDALSSPANFHDRLHLNPSGYARLAALWRDALIDHELLEKCP
jgi:hypothetical protein